MAKKLLSVLIVVAMILSIMPLSVFAEDDILSCLTYEINDGEVTITDCDESISGDVVIPDMIDGYTITSIGNYAFYYCTNLTSITISDSVVNIGSYAFYCCTSLKSVTIGKSVTSIGCEAFSCCSSLESIEIGTGVTSIGDFAFFECISLESIIIPNSVVSIGYGAFAGFSNLKSITIPDSVTKIDDYALGFTWDDDKSEYVIIDDFTIYGNEGTVAESYAKENGITFVALVHADETTTEEPTTQELTTEKPITAEPTTTEQTTAELTTNALNTENHTTAESTTVVGSTTVTTVEVIIGDVDGDGKITAADARSILRISAQLDTIADELVYLADANHDDKITAADARQILRVSAQLEQAETITKTEEQTTAQEMPETTTENQTQSELNIPEQAEVYIDGSYSLECTLYTDDGYEMYVTLSVDGDECHVYTSSADVNFDESLFTLNAAYDPDIELTTSDAKINGEAGVCVEYVCDGITVKLYSFDDTLVGIKYYDDENLLMYIVVESITENLESDVSNDNDDEDDFSYSASKVTVAEAVDFSSWNEIPDNAVPDLYYWSEGQATYGDSPSTSTAQYYEYCVDAAVVEAYIQMLQENGYTLVDSHIQSYKGSSFYSWGFTCDAYPDGETIELMYEDTPCQFCLYYANTVGVYTMIAAGDLSVCDTGLRYSGNTADLQPAGTSAGAGLIKLADGSYQTSDGRLTASVGTAMVLRDGEVYTTDASYKIDGDYEIVKIENFYRNESIYFQTAAYSMLQGDVFTQREMRRWRWFDCTTVSSFEGFNYGILPVLAMFRDGYYLGASHNEKTYESQTVRVMAYDSGGIAVFYFYSKFLSGEPGEVEALCVVDMSQKTGTIEDATYIKVGDTTSVTYSHHESGTSYEVYDWVILEGDDKISISSSGSKCDVTALSPGVATVQVTYSYSAKEPDVLTGIIRTRSHTKTQQYHFIVE